MKRFSTLFAALFIAAACAASVPAAAACEDHLFQGREPELNNPKFKPKTRQLCYSEFAILHSGLSRTPLWVAEHLDRRQARGAQRVRREGEFHAEPNVPEDERAELSDYARSGYDRGHMAPAGNMDSRQSMKESFSLANMVPQAPTLNRNIWREIEEAVLNHVSTFGELYIVTGPIFRGENLKALKGRVLVPTHVYKAIYDPDSGKGAAYLAENKNNARYSVVSLAQLEELAGIDVFPGLSRAVKQTASNLPEPTVRRPRGRRSQADISTDADETIEREPVPSGSDFVSDILNEIDGQGKPQ